MTKIFCVFSCGGETILSRLVRALILVYILILQVSCMLYKYKIQHYPQWLLVSSLVSPSCVQVFGLMLAFQSHKIQMRIFTESNWVAAIIYSTSLCVVVIILSEIALPGLLDAGTALLNTAELIATTIILALVFIPKV